MAVATDRFVLAILCTVLIMVVFAAERVYSVKRRASGREEEMEAA